MEQSCGAQIPDFRLHPRSAPFRKISISTMRFMVNLKSFCGLPLHRGKEIRPQDEELVEKCLEIIKQRSKALILCLEADWA